MEKEKNQSAAGGRRRRDCGYRYMMPSYAVDQEYDPATSYRVLADALLENSSAHGLPTFYVARGFDLNYHSWNICIYTSVQLAANDRSLITLPICLISRYI